MSDVPCNGCTLCCTWASDDIRPRVTEEEAHQYQTEFVNGERVIALAEDTMNCYYLGDDGCTIHTFAPQACKDFDCRDLPAQIAPDALHFSLILARGFNLGMKQ